MQPFAQEDAFNFIYSSLREINAERPPQSPVQLTPETQVLGSGAELDSLELVNLIVRLEDRLADRLNRPVVLVDQDAFEAGGRPFEDVATLASFMVKKANQA
jgi:acyl carrier protein